jgi:serine protease AprX
MDIVPEAVPLPVVDEAPPGRDLTLASVVLLLVCVGVLTAGLLFPEKVLVTRPSAIALEAQADAAQLIGASDLGTGVGVRVCIVDSGIDLGHPDLADVELAGWNDLVNDLVDPYDDHGHGTAMAGLLVAEGGLNGLTPDVELLVAKALASTGEGDDEDVAEAIEWCQQNNAHIISLSLGGAPGALSFLPGSDRASEGAAEQAISQGIFVVAAAGNDGGSDDDGDVASPGSVERVISVGAVHLDGTRWNGSSLGDNDGRVWPLPMLLPRQDPDKKPEVVAPGAGVAVLHSASGGWSLVDGTSAATVHVTAALALLLEHRPDLRAGEMNNTAEQTIDNVKQILMETAKPQPGQEGHDDAYGYGIVRVDRLLSAYA